MRKKTKRDHLLSEAGRLFAANGFHATGIDRILAEAGVAKMTLYNHFSSKDALIVAVLSRESRAFFAWSRAEMKKRGAGVSPQARLLTIFDAHEDWFAADTFHGCLFQKACAEFPGPRHPVHMEASAHKRRLYDFVLKLAREAGARDAESLAQALLILLEGATAVAHVSSAPIAARRAKRAARPLFREAGLIPGGQSFS